MTNTTNIGRRAEAAVCKHLESLGYRIIEQNWRTRWCEVDIIASKDDVVYFVEVKYRRDQSQGTGLNYVTPSKLKQMHFAAEFWLASQDIAADAELAAAAVEGPDFLVSDFIVGLD